MKKVVVLLAIFAVMGSVLTAQTVTLWNELFTNTVAINASGKLDSNGDVTTGDAYFWGFRDRFHATVNADRWGAVVRVQSLLQGTNKDWDAALLSCSATHANVTVRPVNFLKVVFGINYTEAIPGSYLTDARDDFGNAGLYVTGNTYPTASASYVGIGRYGKDGATVSLKFFENNFTLAFGLPTPQTWKDMDTGAKLNIALNYFFKDLKMNIGGVFGADIATDGNQKFGVYWDYAGLKGLILKAGFTGYTKGGANAIVPPTALGDEFAAQVDFMFRYGVGAFNVEADFDATFGNKDAGEAVTPFNVYLGFDGRVLDKKLFWFVRGGFSGVFFNESKMNVWEFNVKPGIQFSVNAHHRLDAAIQIGMRSYGEYVGNGTALSLAIPLAWRYTF